MSLWEFLAGLLPDSLVHVEQDNTDITFVNTGGGHSLTGVSEGEEGVNVLSVDLQSLTPEERSELIARTWDDQGEIFIANPLKTRKRSKAQLKTPISRIH